MANNGPYPRAVAGWDTAPLEELADFITKGTTPTTLGFQWEESGVPFLRSECVGEGGRFIPSGLNYISHEANAALARSEVAPGDILLTITGYVGKACIYPSHLPPGNINQHIARIRIKATARARAEYVFQALASRRMRDYFSSIVTGQAYPQISLKQVREAEVPLPGLDEQHRIAELLGAADDSIDAGEAVAAQLDRVRRDLLRERFEGDSATGWELKKLGDVARVIGGCTFPLELQGRVDLEIPLFKVSDMNSSGNERVAAKTANYVSRSMLAEMRGKPCPPGTTIFPKVGAALLTNKRRMLGVEAAFDNNVMGLVPTSIDPEFLYYFMKTIDFRSMAQTGALPSVNGGAVASIPIRVPPPAEQRIVAASLRATDEAFEAQTACLAERRRVKAALADEVLTGKIRVPRRDGP